MEIRFEKEMRSDECQNVKRKMKYKFGDLRTIIKKGGIE